MPTPTAYKVTVTEIAETADVHSKTEPREVFSQSFPAEGFDMNAMVLALNRKKRQRKARGKETANA